MPTSKQTLNLGQYKLSIPNNWRLNGQRKQIEEQIKNILEESGCFSKIEKIDKRDNHSTQGLQFKRFFTKDGAEPLNSVRWVKRDCRITNTDGSTIYEIIGAEVPENFSQVASDIMISKYFRKAGVPQYDERGRQILTENGSPKLGPERSAKQVIKRMVGCWRDWGERYGYFRSTQDAKIFADELTYMLANQMAAPNSPQWFNTGIAWAYNIKGRAQGHYYVDPDTGLLTKSVDAYTRPQPHACFIQSVRDDLINSGGIMDLWIREARIFKYGSGTGTNFSAIRGRGETLSGGGTSSGLMSFLKIGDRAAAAIKSGGTTRRAAKMVSLDIDHPEIEEFITWKANEEKKVQTLVNGGYSADYEGEAYETVSGQNSNNSIRITNDYMRTVDQDGLWSLRWRTDGRVDRQIPARDLWSQIANSAWISADPGVQYDTTINQWHTCPNSGPIRASNPCSEFMFLDDSACNLASLNLIKFFDEKTKTLDIEAYKYAIRIWTIVLEISVTMAQFPSRAIARNSYDFRPLGLGYANLGTLLMVAGLPYDSPKARNWATAIAAIMTGESYLTSAELAAQLGPFAKYSKNREAMLRVIRNHRRAAWGVGLKEVVSPELDDLDDYENLDIKPQPLNPAYCPQYLVTAAREAWDQALAAGTKHGFRNAQVTVIAPTGTIGLLMDCDTTGVEPDFALVKFKKLAGGGYWKIPNQSLEPALRNLGYNQDQIKDIITYIVGANSLDNSSPVNTSDLLRKGLTEQDLQKIFSELPRIFEIKNAFSNYILGEETLKRLGIPKDQSQRPDFNLLTALGYSSDEQKIAGRIICGQMTAEGAPYLKAEHLSVFDCANKCGSGSRFIEPLGHVKMLAAVQPFISGSISKTINLPHSATVQEIQDIYWQTWQLGLKAVALYRDGCKLSQPLSSATSDQATETTATLTEEKIPLVETSPTTPVVPTLSPQSKQLSFIERGTKKDLPNRRKGVTIEATVAGHKLFLRTGEYEDGKLGEIFIDMHKEGAAFRSLLNCFAIAVSLGLQYGVPLKKYVDKFTFTRFEPNGVTDHPNIKTATSIIDFIFRILGMEFLNRFDFVHVLPEKAMNPMEINGQIAPSNGQTSLPLQTTANTPTVETTAPSTYGNDQTSANQLSAFNSNLMGDAPACSECGHITVRNGNCYRCLNCGTSMGCS